MAKQGQATVSERQATVSGRQAQAPGGELNPGAEQAQNRTLAPDTQDVEGSPRCSCPSLPRPLVQLP